VYEMGWATDIQTHSEKAFPSVGTTALGLFFVFCFFAVICKSKNCNRIIQLLERGKIGIVENIHNKRIKQVKIKREKGQ